MTTIDISDLSANDFDTDWAHLIEQAEHYDGAALDQAKGLLERGRQLVRAGFRAGVDIEALVTARSDLIDRILVNAWSQRVDSRYACLVAVGGYGRSELLPHSDIDLMVLYEDGQLAHIAPTLEDLVAFLWDIGLEIGHSVRSPVECAEQAATDVTIMTNLLEARPLTGNMTLFAAMSAATTAEHIWPSADYFQAKVDEQTSRHLHYDETAYKLEPNTKESPGGLRDIQTVAWVAKRQFSTHTLDGLVDYGFLSEREFKELKRGQAFLWRVRFALHMLTDRAEDRLLFDHQIKVAELFGYTDQRNSLAVEQFMQRYYRNIKALTALNDILLQLFSEAILHAHVTDAPTAINARFQSQHGFIGVTHDEVFRETPSALLEIFYQMQIHPQLAGVRAHTLRLMRRDRHLLDHTIRSSLRCRQLFRDILQQGNGVTRALRRMNRYGILGLYLPNFGRIIGRMQYDLFHTLTVDEHSLFVIRNLRRLKLPRFDNEMPFASELMQSLDDPHILYVAGLMHDIAKGRGGDHSELGAVDARTFCTDHGLSVPDTELVCWLVHRHLLMSMTAQRRDINDPDIIHEFAREVGTQGRLDRLFLLTICDIRATNPNLWNTWKESLLTSLYTSTSRALERGLDDPIEEDELVNETRNAAAKLLKQEDVDSTLVQAIWARLDTEYFLRHSPEEIARQTRAIARHNADTPLVSLIHIGDQGTTLFIYTRDRDYLFGIATGVLAQMGLTILDARINSTRDDYTIDTYVICEQDGSAITNDFRRREIEQNLHDAIADPDVVHIEVTRRASRRSRHFDVPTKIRFSGTVSNDCTSVEITAADRPGLLSMIGDVFREYGIVIETAKIATVGERAEDVFLVTDQNQQPLTDPAVLEPLRAALVDALDND